MVQIFMCTADTNHHISKAAQMTIAFLSGNHNFPRDIRLVQSQLFQCRSQQCSIGSPQKLSRFGIRSKNGNSFL